MFPELFYQRNQLGSLYETEKTVAFLKLNRDECS